MTGRLLQAAEVAEQWQRTPGFVLAEARAGRLGHVRVGRAYRFAQADVDAYVAQHRAVVAPPTHWGVRTRGRAS